MRRLVLPCVFIASLPLASCSSASAPTDGTIGSEREAIAFGSADDTHPHTAVVALLAPGGMPAGSFEECSGTVVQVKNGNGYVLTAAHCCNMSVPNVVIMAADYGPYSKYVFSPPKAPAYPVIAGSVYYDTQYNGNDHDFCMLKFAAPANTPVIPVAQPGQDQLAIGVDVEHVGFGVTDTTDMNSVRRIATQPLDQKLTSLVLQSSQGGPTNIEGVCEGDSGGPSLVPAGADQTQQMVVGTTSYGNSKTCNQNTLSVCSRVTSETGPNGFITNFLNDTPSGTAATTSSASTCQSCQSASLSQGGDCAAAYAACSGSTSCNAILSCDDNCTSGDSACTQACYDAQPAGQAGFAALNNCICAPTACGATCTTACEGTPTCGVAFNPAACDTCVSGACCAEAQACAVDGTCFGCLVNNPPASCSSNALVKALLSCAQTSCATACGLATTTSAATTTSTGTGASATSAHASATSSGSGANATGSTGAAGTTGSNSAGVGGAGTGGGDGSGGTTDMKSGCSVSTIGGPSERDARGWLAMLMIGAAIGVSSRRRFRRDGAASGPKPRRV